MKSLRKLVVACILSMCFLVPQLTYGENAVQWYDKGVAYYLAKDYSSAIIAYSEAIKEDPRLLFAYLDRGGCYMNNRDSAHAIADFSKVIEIDPMMEKAYIRRAIAFVHKRELESAILDLDTAIRINGNNSFSYFYRGELYARKGQLDLAIEDYSHAVKIDGGNEDYYLSRAAAYDIKNEYDLAVRDYSTVLALNPNKISAYLARGNLYFYQKNYELAVSDANAVLELQPNNAEAFLNRGISLYYLSNYKLAIRDYDKAIELKYPRLHFLYFYKGIAYEKNGQFRDAYQAYQLALNQAVINDSSFPLNELKRRLGTLQNLYGQGNEHETKITSWVEKESPISSAEKSVIKTLTTIFDAYNKKDFRQFEVNYKGPKSITLFEEFVNNAKDFTLQAAEVYSYSDKMIRGRVTFSYQALNANHLGITIIFGQADIYMEKIENRWVLVETRKYVSSDDSMKSLLMQFQIREKAKQRYGTENLANWQGE